jgi:hypothetical protein
MKNHPLVAASFLVLTSFAVAPLVAQAPVRDGRWEVTTTMEMPDMPMKMPPMKSEQCITKEMAADPTQSVPKGQGPGGPGGDCKVSDYKMAGNKVTWAMACTGKTPMTGTGEIVYGNNTYDGAMKMKMEGREMTMKYTAKRLGDCTK